uniref:Transmembrane protein 256 n=1 Tax=Echinococcus canadensis TaxID=519352 RepID=A0A915EVL9_9CEST
MDSLRAVYRFVSWPVTRVVEKTIEVPIKSSGGGYAKLAGVLGATAIAALAYSAHGKFSLDLSFRNAEKSEERRHTFKNGADIHILHSLALLGVRSSRFPQLTASLLLTGTILFSGTCYYTALSNDNRFVRIAPIGGVTLILAWLSFAL